MLIRHGTRPIRKDHRDLSYARTFGAVSPVSFPSGMNVDAGLGMPNQNALGLPMGCTGFTTSELESDVSKQKNSPKFTYDKTLMMEGKTGDYNQGCDIRDSLRSAAVYGILRSIEISDAQALNHRCGKYFNVIDAPNLDAFDDIRNAILLNNRPVSIGTPWFREWEQIGSDGVIPSFYTGDPDALPWHNWKICGWLTIGGEPYLIGKTWQGSTYGDKGFAYFPRLVINKVMAIAGTGAFTLADFDPNNPEDVATVKLDIWETIASYIAMWIDGIMKTKTPPLPAPVTLPPMTPSAAQTPEPEVPVTSVPNPAALLWDTPEHVRHSVRVMCDNANFWVKDKNDLTACVYQESQFDPEAKGKVNSDGTRDYGLCQYNTGKNAKGVPYWIGAGAAFASIEEVLSDPEKNVRIMISEWKSGEAGKRQWASYSTGAYRKWLTYVTTPVPARGYY